MTDAELGLLTRVIHFAWERQGITESNLTELARIRRIPLDNLLAVWPDFIALSEQRNGIWMTVEQWAGVDNYAQKVEAGKNRQKNSLTENKGLTGVTAEGTLDDRSSTAEQNRVEKKRIEEKLSNESREEEKGLPKKTRSTSQPCDEEFLEALQQEEAYRDLDVRHSYAKMVAWCKINNHHPTRRRFINWLNREDRTFKPESLSDPPAKVDLSNLTPAEKDILRTCEIHPDLLTSSDLRAITLTARRLEQARGYAPGLIPRFSNYWREHLRRTAPIRPQYLTEHFGSFLVWIHNHASITA